MQYFVKGFSMKKYNEISRTIMKYIARIIKTKTSQKSPQMNNTSEYNIQKGKKYCKL